MNVFLLAACSPISVCVLLLNFLGLWLARRAENVGGCLNEWEKESCQKRATYRFPSHMTCSKRKIYFCAEQMPLGFQTRRRSRRHLHVTTQSNKVPKTTLFWCLPIFVFGKTFYLCLLVPIFNLCALCRLVLIIEK